MTCSTRAAPAATRSSIAPWISWAVQRMERYVDLPISLGSLALFASASSLRSSSALRHAVSQEPITFAMFSLASGPPGACALGPKPKSLFRAARARVRSSPSNAKRFTAA